jgi:hypothetical protein
MYTGSSPDPHLLRTRLPHLRQMAVIQSHCDGAQTRLQALFQALLQTLARTLT